MARYEDRPPMEPETPEHEDEKIRRSRRARAMLDVEQAPINYVWRHYRKRCANLDEAVEFLAKHAISQRDVMLTAQLLWGVVEELGLLGDVKAATYGVDRALGVPDRPFVEQVADMSLSEIIAEFENGWKELGVSEEMVEAALARGCQRKWEER